jgi:RNA methyltransferase, TrmH family
VIRQALLAGIELKVLVLREGEQFEAPSRRRVTLGRGLLRELSATATPQGVLALGHARPVSFEEARQAAARAGWPLVVLDGVQDPGNVGAIARTAAAAGAPSLVVLPGTADPLGTKAIRASAGHVFQLRLARATWDDLAGIRCVGADAGGRPLAEVDLAAAGALVLGSEAHGVSRKMELVALPMAPGVESLNVAAAGAILLYELRARISG